MMQFTEGQIVVHPHHGPATITAMPNRTIRQTTTRYLTLEVHHTDLVVGVPVATAEEIGVRPVIDRATADKVFALLTEPSGHSEANWSRRIKHDVERFRTGDVATVTSLVRDLTRRREDKGLSLGERDLLRDARRPMVTELALALGMTEDEVGPAIDAAILQGVLPATRLPQAG